MTTKITSSWRKQDDVEALKAARRWVHQNGGQYITLMDHNGVSCGYTAFRRLPANEEHGPLEESIMFEYSNVVVEIPAHGL